ncbi:MAG TPA: zf-TFIIB domain-containing protein [Planctomycetota bacterium]|nr:zf-TFIIB domain-containing protein [Planctomycetota bacterium]
MRVLKCPVCLEPMIVAEYEHVEIDTCVGCGGVWLDGGELEALVGSAVPPKATPDPDLGPPDRDCPICVHKLAKDRYGRTQVVVDKCPHGDGIWLDAGELEQILAAHPQAPGEPKGHDDHGAGALRGFFNAPRPSPQKNQE